MKIDDVRRTNLISFVKDGLPLVARPFQAVARGLGWSEGEVLAELKALVDARIIRRIAGVVNHRKLGLQANALVLLRVPEAGLEQAAACICQFKQVSHCYQRTPGPEFPYNLYAMVHARNRTDGREILNQLQRMVAPSAFVVLWSTEEFKKTGLPLLTGAELGEAFP